VVCRKDESPLSPKAQQSRILGKLHFAPSWGFRPKRSVCWCSAKPVTGIRIGCTPPRNTTNSAFHASSSESCWRSNRSRAGFFSIESLFFLQRHWQSYPAQHERLRSLINQHQLRLTGTGITTPDTVLPDTERFCATTPTDSTGSKTMA